MQLLGCPSPLKGALVALKTAPEGGTGDALLPRIGALTWCLLPPTTLAYPCPCGPQPSCSEAVMTQNCRMQNLANPRLLTFLWQTHLGRSSHGSVAMAAEGTTFFLKKNFIFNFHWF